MLIALQGATLPTQQGPSQVLPVLREVQEGLAGQLERVKELTVALQDVERGKHASMSQLVQQVADRRALRPGAADNERLRQEVRSRPGLAPMHVSLPCAVHFSD